MPDVILIAGPNGAGKSTLAPALLRDAFGFTEYVNADTVARGLSAFAPEDAAFEAGRVVLRRLKALANENRDFAFETTLSSRFYARWLKELQEKGYYVHLIFLWLISPELAEKRVHERVRAGGHNVPPQVIIRRYYRGIDNFFRTYRELADSWQLLNASEDIPVEIAIGAKITGTTIIDSELWRKIEK